LGKIGRKFFELNFKKVDSHAKGPTGGSGKNNALNIRDREVQGGDGKKRGGEKIRAGQVEGKRPLGLIPARKEKTTRRTKKKARKRPSEENSAHREEKRYM